MARLTYTPDRGDLVHVNLSPSAGRELTGPHYALVLSPRVYNRATGLLICVAVTSRIRGGPFEVALPRGHLPAKAGAGMVDSVILCDALRQLDFRQRSMAFTPSVRGRFSTRLRRGRWRLSTRRRSIDRTQTADIKRAREYWRVRRYNDTR